MRQVRDYLTAVGLSVWTDERLKPGTQRWNVAVEHAIEHAACVVVLLSPAAKESEWVGRELDYAIAQRKAIFPALIEGDERTAIPLSVISMQWSDLRVQAGLPALLSAVTHHLNQEPTRPTVRPVTRSMNWLVAGVVAIVVVGGGLLLLLNSGLLVTAEQTPTATSVPAAAQLVATTVTATASLDCPITDDFTGPSANDWFIDTSESSAISINNGAYEIAILGVNDPAGGVSWGSLRGVTLGDVRIEATMRASEFTGTLARTGLWLRYQDANNFLAFMISSSGKYRIARFESGYTSLVDWTDSAAIQTGDNAVNIMRIDSNGSTFDLYINDTFLSRVTDDTWSTGRVAFFGSTSEPPASFYLDSIRICENEA